MRSVEEQLQEGLGESELYLFQIRLELQQLERLCSDAGTWLGFVVVLLGLILWRVW